MGEILKSAGEKEQGVIVIKKLIISLLTVVLIASTITPATAATKEELTEQVAACQVIKDKAHEMAECARFLGFDEDHIIIQTAKAKWMEAYTEELNLQEQIEELESAAFVWDGPVLTRTNGTVMGPSGKETYYNLPMQGVVNRMRRLGYDAENWPYWIRDDGAKMLGNYILCAASFDIRPIGTILETTRGKAIVADTGSFARYNKTQIDLAFQW